MLVDGDYAAIDTFQRLARTLSDVKSNNVVNTWRSRPTTPTIVQSLTNVGLNRRGRLVVEKPFGRDLQSAIELNRGCTRR